MKIRVECRGENFEIATPSGLRLLDGLRSADIPVNAACGGGGSCHKCRVQVTEGFVGISPADRRAFSAAELAGGWRLSCQSTVRTNLSCRVPDVENLRAGPRLVRPAVPPSSTAHPLLACDLGSTGVVVALANERGELIVEAHLLNRQVRYGADVMSRLKTVQDRGSAPLRDALVDTLALCLRAIETEEPALYAAARSEGLFCAGNSALVSFLHGWETESLAVYPFQPLHRQAFESSLDALGLRLRSLPLLGGFVGADTYACVLAIETGALATGAPNPPWMLVDIGTNTEVVLATADALWFASAPAGPAFEGGNIALGMRAEPGAIARAHYASGRWELETIGNDRARGICGSGLVDAIAEGVRAGLVHRDGFLPTERLQLSETVYLVADDIREFQLAKSATRTACDLLIERAGVKPERIYLAGAFAEHLRMDAVAGTGLLPAELPVETIGNASLKGALVYAAASSERRAEWETSFELRRRPVELALQDDFQSAFVTNLNF